MDHGSAGQARESRTFPATADQVREARRFAGKVLEQHPRQDDLVLIVDELAANAVTHTRSGQGGSFEVVVITGPGEVRVYVHDAGSAGTIPHIPRQAVTTAGGRGLAIVGALADEWGYSSDDGAGVTWCLLRDGAAEPAAIIR